MASSQGSAALSTTQAPKLQLFDKRADILRCVCPLNSSSCWSANAAAKIAF